MAEILMRKRKANAGEVGLFPVDDLSREELAHVRADKDALVSAKTPRNPKQHRLIWALAQKIADATDMPGAEAAMDLLKLRARHFKIVTNPRNGMTYLVPKSIAFASLDQAAFSRLLDRMIYVACTEIIPGLPEGDLRAEIEAMVLGEEAQAPCTGAASEPAPAGDASTPPATNSEPKRKGGK